MNQERSTNPFNPIAPAKALGGIVSFAAGSDEGFVAGWDRVRNRTRPPGLQDVRSATGSGVRPGLVQAEEA
jgi:hypothetical protein